MPETATAPWWGSIPFALLLVCIAVFPLLPGLQRIWQRVSAKLAVALLFAVPVGLSVAAAGGGRSVVHALVEYAQFICLLLSLYVVSGGIFVSGDVPAAPRTNLLLLAIGAIAASVVGTTGAAMLLIRPLLAINRQRQHKVHTVIFAIFVVANCGGLLTPLGDPPLFLGFLRGVPFAWTLTLLPEWLFVNGLLLASYFALDRRLHVREPAAALRRDEVEREPIELHGGLNLVWLTLIVAAVALVPSVDLAAREAADAPWTMLLPWRELYLLAVAALSLLLGDRQVRYHRNAFSWGPILEVAALFIGIFVTMVPALRYLGVVAPRLGLGPVGVFVSSASLSSVLDNAPTYATFFELARHHGASAGVAGVAGVVGVPEAMLTALSLGSVLGGAGSYIGNGPNFMVKAIAESAGIVMPSFGGYVVRWSLRYLGPVLGLMVLVFVVQDWRLRAVGTALATLYLGAALWRAWRVPRP